MEDRLPIFINIPVIVEPLDNDAKIFYERYGFIKLPDSGKMFLTMMTIKGLFERNFSKEDEIKKVKS